MNERNPEPKGYTKVDIEDVRQVQQMGGTEAALWMLYRLRTDRTPTGAWTSTIADDAAMIGASESAVKRARRKLQERKRIELWETVNHRGNGPDIVVVIANVPGGMTTAAAGHQHASARGLRLRTDTRPKTSDGRECDLVSNRQTGANVTSSDGRECDLAETGANSRSRSSDHTQTTVSQNTTVATASARLARNERLRDAFERPARIFWSDLLRDAFTANGLQLAREIAIGAAHVLEEHEKQATVGYAEGIAMRALERVDDGANVGDATTDTICAWLDIDRAEYWRIVKENQR